MSGRWDHTHAKPIAFTKIEATGKEGACERCRRTIRPREVLHVRKIAGKPWIVHQRCDVVT